MNRTVLAILVSAALIAIAQAGPVRAEARVLARSPGNLVARLENLLGGLDITTSGRSVDGRYYVTVFATPEQLAAIRARGLDVLVSWPDIRDKFRAMTGCEPGSLTGRDFGYYLTYWEMRDSIYRLHALYPTITHLDSSMRSFQNRALYCLKISDNPDSTENEPQVFINGATHAREPMGTTTCISFASGICRDYGYDSAATWLVNNREIYIVPVMNPDGYVYNSDSGGSSSYWRKNRNSTPPRTGPGIDLNRNYGFKWGYDDNGSSPDPNSDIYRGPSRWSEPEAAAIRDFEAAHKFRTGIDFHTYAQDNLYPWAYINTSPPELALITEIADSFMSNNGYTNTGQWYSALYPSNGVSIDWELSDTAISGVSKFRCYSITSELGINDFWYGWNDPPYVDSEVARNVPNCYYMTRYCGVFLNPVGMVVNDTLTGNGDGQLDPGEAANLWFTMNNRALHALDTAKSVTAVLASSDTLVRVLTPLVSLPNLAPRRGTGDNRANQIQIEASPDITPETVVNLRLEVTFTDDSVTIMQPLSYLLTIGNHVGISAPPTVTPSLSPSLAVFPNPCAGVAQLRLTVPTPQSVALHVYDGSGRLVRTLWTGQRPAGTSDFRLLTSDFPPGVYFARLLGTGSSACSRFVVGR